MLSLGDQQIKNSIRLLKSEIAILEAQLNDENHGLPSILRRVSKGMLLSAQRVKDLVWTSYP